MIVPVDEMFVEAFGCHEAFRRLGFNADDIYVSVNLSATLKVRCLYVILKTQGKEFVVTVARVPDDQSDRDVLDGWSRAVELLQKAGPEQGLHMWQQSTLGKDVAAFQSLAIQVISKGITIGGLNDDYDRDRQMPGQN
jgi:hypothetical protein